MKKHYYYLWLDDLYQVLVAQDNTDRVGLLGVNFTAQARADKYVEQLNREAQAKPDNDTEGS